MYHDYVSLELTTIDVHYTWAFLSLFFFFFFEILVLLLLGRSPMVEVKLHMCVLSLVLCSNGLDQ